MVPSDPAENTRSPGRAWEAGMRGPEAHCCWLVRGMVIPAAR